MPVIEAPITGSFFALTDPLLSILAAMTYPLDADRRRLWFASAMAHQYVTYLDAGAKPPLLRDLHGCIGPLWTAALPPRRIYEDGFVHSRRGIAAGQVLLILLPLAKHHHRHGTIERARALLAHIAKRKKFAASESLIEKAWPEFKGVAHFWAALGDLNVADAFPDFTDRASVLGSLGPCRSLSARGRDKASRASKRDLDTRSPAWSTDKKGPDSSSRPAGPRLPR